jgi:hypothetical protein
VTRPSGDASEWLPSTSLLDEARGTTVATVSVPGGEGWNGSAHVRSAQPAPARS